MQHLRYTYRLRPGAKATALLEAEWDRCRWVWNQCVSRDAELRAEDGIRTSEYALSRELTDWRGRYWWLAAGSSSAQHAVIRQWWRARRAILAAAGFNGACVESVSHLVPTGIGAA